jgi:hypothetical protein
VLRRVGRFIFSAAHARLIHDYLPADPLPDGRSGFASAVVKDVRWPSGQEQDISGL